MILVPHWQIDLQVPPRIVLLGTATHGETRLTESYYSHHWVLLFFNYTGEVVVDEHALPVAPGMLGLFPPGTNLVIRYRGRSLHHYAHLALPAGRAREITAQALTPLGRKAGEIERRYLEAIHHFALRPS